MDQEFKILMRDLREVVILSNISARWHEKGRMTREEAYAILRKGMLKAESMLKQIAQKAGV